SLIGLGSLIYGIIEGPDKGWNSPSVLAAFLFAAIGLVAFVVWERRSPHPMLPLALFRDRRMSVGSGVITTAFFVMFGLFFLFSMYLQFVRGYSPLSAGLATLPLAVMLVAIAPRSAGLAERVGTGPVIATGFLLVAAGFAVFATISPTTPYLVIVVALVLLGAGMSLTAAPATGSIMSAVPPAKAGVGSAVNDTTREVGGALGIAVLGSVANAVYRSGINLNGLGLPGPVRAAASESIGAATVIAGGIPGGRELANRAGAAFTNALNLASTVAAGLALVAAGVVAVVYSRRAEAAAGAPPATTTSTADAADVAADEPEVVHQSVESDAVPT
ncbi:MAG: MFS transporter, partial [Actinomycetota bacterium]|nr:MFS transporter [Actinomycetota bacterium]